MRCFAWRSQLKQLLQERCALAVDAKDAQKPFLFDDPEGGAHGWAPFSVEPWMASPKMVDLLANQSEP